MDSGFGAKLVYYLKIKNKNFCVLCSYYAKTILLTNQCVDIIYIHPAIDLSAVSAAEGYIKGCFVIPGNEWIKIDMGLYSLFEAMHLDNYILSIMNTLAKLYTK